MTKKNTNKIILAVCALLILGGLLGIFIMSQKNDSGPVFCTQDAMLCPDGSYVSRHGPKCEFDACPTLQLHSYSDGKVSFKYPDIMTTYISAQTWPPKVTIKNTKLNCSTSSTQKIISDKTFCVTEIHEGAAGSTYTTYDYSAEINNKFVTFEFVLRFNQCYNYGNPAQTECLNERSIFNPDNLLIPIINSFAFVNSGVSAISGTVVIGPTCPVMQNPPLPECNDKPYKVNLAVFDAAGVNLIKQFSSNTDGKFYVEIPAGDYTIQNYPVANILPRCSSNGSVTVPKNTNISIIVSCDSGIR